MPRNRVTARSAAAIPLLAVSAGPWAAGAEGPALLPLGNGAGSLSALVTHWATHWHWALGAASVVLLIVSLIRRHFQRVQARIAHEVKQRREAEGRLLREAAEHRQLAERLRENESYTQLLLNNAPFPVIIVRLADHQVRYGNRRALEAFRFARDGDPALLNLSTLFLQADDFIRFAAELQERKVAEEFEAPLQRCDGSVYWAVITASLTDYEGRLAIFAALRDITERKKLEASVRESEERFRLLAENATDVLSTMDYEGRLTYVSPAITALSGYSPEEALGQGLEERVCPGSLDTLREAMDRVRLEARRGGRAPQVVQIEQPRKDGTTVWVETALRNMYDHTGKALAILAMTRDIDQRKAMERKLQRLANHDPLTGVYNRRRFMELLEHEIARCRRYGHTLSALLLDLDHFKRVNDTHGHASGDEVLRQFATAAGVMLRASDFLGRLGGEEFAVALPETDALEAATVAGRVRAIVAAAPVTFADKRLFVTVSIGVATLTDGEAGDLLLQRADAALYEAKNGGRNCVRLAREPSRKGPVTAAAAGEAAAPPPASSVPTGAGHRPETTGRR